MKIFKNKFFIIIISIILLLFSLQFYFVSNSYKRDTNSYVILLEWAATLTKSTGKKVLNINVKEKLDNDDVVNTLKNSLAVIEWWDRSITRLWSNSKIKIKDTFVWENLEKISISFELLKWRTWSNVVSIFSWDSSFIQEIKWTSAAVRGTVFEASYDDEYLLVHKHEVKLTQWNGETLYAYPGKIYSIKDFSLEKMKEVLDEAFIKFNQKLDAEHLERLRTEFLSHMKSSSPFTLLQNLYESEVKVYDMILSQEDKKNMKEYIENLPQEKKEKILQTLQNIHQKLSFENGENEYLYNLKMNTRDLLLENSQDEEYKKTLVRYTIYDLQDIFSLKKFQAEMTKNTIALIWKNIEYYEKIKQNFQSQDFELIKNLFSGSPSEINLNTIKNKLSELDAKWNAIIHEWLNKLLELYKK